MPEPANSLAVAVAPNGNEEWIVAAVREGGGRITPPAEAQALIWDGKGPDGLAQMLAEGKNISWVQLPSAGVERYASLLDRDHDWTCAKGIYGRAVAEHALALALAGIHQLPLLARKQTWERTLCRDLSGGTVTIVGGGGIARALLDLLAPFGAMVIVVRRHAEPMAGAGKVLSSDRLHEALPEADAVILAAALTPETKGMIGMPELCRMKEDAWLVNVGRGGLVRTDDLVTALREHIIGGAALDVTDPEPLPEGHALWQLPNCLITPHCANPPPLEHERYAELIAANVQRRREGEPLEGTVSPDLGY